MKFRHSCAQVLRLAVVASLGLCASCAPSLRSIYLADERACSEGKGPKWPQKCSTIGGIYWSGSAAEGFPVDPVRAAALWSRACTREHQDACVFMITRGVTLAAKDPVAAAAVYLQVCEAGFTAGCLHFADLQRAGRGVAKNPAVALEVYRGVCRTARGPSKYKSDQSLMDAWKACYAMDLMYRHGDGPVRADEVRAKKLEVLAAAIINQRTEVMWAKHDRDSETARLESEAQERQTKLVQEAERQRVESIQAIGRAVGSAMQQIGRSFSASEATTPSPGRRPAPAKGRPGTAKMSNVQPVRAPVAPGVMCTGYGQSCTGKKCCVSNGAAVCRNDRCCIPIGWTCDTQSDCCDAPRARCSEPTNGGVTPSRCCYPSGTSVSGPGECCSARLDPQTSLCQ